MSPWWLRPTAESESADDGDRAESADPAESRAEEKPSKGPAPSEEPEAERKPARPSRRSSTRKKKTAEVEEPAADGRKSSSSRRKEPPAKSRNEPPATGRKETAPQDGRRVGGRGRQERQEKEPAPVTHDITPADIASIHRELSDGPAVPGAVPERTQDVSDERKIALFCDLENIALGVRDSDIKKFDINLVLERLLEKGKVIVKRAYCDWERYSEYKRAFHEAAIEMLDIPQKYYSGKNSADIKMVVDAMDLCYSNEHLDTFVLLSGDSDFSPLVSKLREADKYVIGMGVKNSSSALLVDNCDEFIYYEDLWRDRQSAPEVTAGANKKASEAFRLMIDAIQALLRENKDVLWGSMIKQTMQRKKPSFNEGYYGYGSFSELLEDAERQSILKLKKDQRSGSYVVTGFAKKG